MDKKCSVHDCWRPHHAKGFCSVHWQRWRRNGTPERIKAVNKGKTCSIDGCDEWAHKNGVCRIHYGRWLRRGDFAERKRKRSHPLYLFWQPRKKAGLLVKEWENFWKFVEDVGERPSKNHFLIRPIIEWPFGPTNWLWQEHLQRRLEETKKEWHARKWQSRRARDPSYEAGRWFKRKYGITTAQYDAMFLEQNGVCAICNQAETSFEHRTGGMRRLAVDHCHKTNRVRGLLCFRCNRTIGSVEDSIELLDACRDYLLKRGDT